MSGPDRFDGEIAGVGTASGTRLVLGMWRDTPFGPIADAMIERPDGHRILVAPSPEVADYIGATYGFDETRVEPVELWVNGPTRTFVSQSLRVRLEAGHRTPLGRLLRLVPEPLARARWWCRLVDPVASIVRRGVHTVGTAGHGRREWYCATDEHALVTARAELDGVELGPLRPVTPAVRFGFASTPSAPAMVEVTTWIRSGSTDLEPRGPVIERW